MCYYGPTCRKFYAEEICMQPKYFWVSMLTLGALSLSPSTAEAGREPAQQALGVERLEKKPTQDVVQNRFFLKQGRSEFSPIFGIVPNNPMVKRYTGGLLYAYHFSESLAAEGAFIYSPDLGENDLKGLTNTLVQIAASSSSSSVEFQQPLEKMLLGATFAARWAPIYGKLNPFGIGVVNFDFYGVAGLGMLSTELYYAKFDPAAPEGEAPTLLESAGRQTRVPLNLGVGLDIFLNQSISFKLDARSYLYFAPGPQYDPNATVPPESRLYNNFVASAGVSIFVPKMKARRVDF